MRGIFKNLVVKKKVEEASVASNEERRDKRPTAAKIISRLAATLKYHLLCCEKIKIRRPAAALFIPLVPCCYLGAGAPPP